MKGYTDKQASEQLGAKLERLKAKSDQELIDPFKTHRNRPVSEHVADWIAGCANLVVMTCTFGRAARDCSG